MSDEIIKTYRVPYLNFRPHLRGSYRRQYDEAWNKFCHDITHGNVEKDIESLLKFTEHRTLANVLFIWHNLWVRFRLKVSGPDKETAKETKEFIEKYFAHNDPPKK
jgi:hypothetical protein